MKKTIFILSLLLTLGLVSCERKPKASLFKDADLVIVDHGELVLYDVETKQLTPYEKETDSVINLVFDNNNHLYYSVAIDGNLSLKMLDMNQTNPEPKTCVDWEMTIDDAIDFMFGSVSDIYFDEQMENIFIYKMDYDAGFMKPVIYNIKSGKKRMLNEEEFFNLNNNDNCNVSHFFTEEHRFYYVTPDGKACINDKIDFSKYFDSPEEVDDVEFYPVSTSPQGEYLVYSSIVAWGEGWGYYCVASTDGSFQLLLDNSDVWRHKPEWLPNGSLVYADIDGNIQLLDIQENQDDTAPVTVISLGNLFAVKPFAKQPQKEPIGNLEGCDVAIFDQGKVVFYNSEAKTFVPFIWESDSVVNGVFVDEYCFFYTVAIGQELYLKNIYLSDYANTPSMVTDWDLQLDDCVSETYGKVSSLVYLPAFSRVGINHNFSWDFYNFADIKFYDISNSKKLNGWSEDEDIETDILDDEFLQYEEDLERFESIDGKYYYKVADDQQVCVSDKIDFKKYVSDPEYYSDPEFVLLSIDPTRKLAAYAALIEWGDLGHGPLCIATLDGAMQKAFKDTDAANLTHGWLNDGSLLYVGEEPRPTDDPEYDPEWNNTKPCIKIAHPDGASEVFSHSTSFVVCGK